MPPGVAAPPRRRRVRPGFGRSGLLHVECFEAALATAGVALAQARTLLDWGAGAGRMTAHLPARAPRAQVTAVDTDAEAIGWLAENHPVGRPSAIPVMPPTDLAGDTFEIVIGHSVFSHLAVARRIAGWPSSRG